MAIYAITGNLGSGKSLVSVGRIQEYLLQGRKVATNLNLNLEKLLTPRSKNTYVRLPDFPSRDDFELLGLGNESTDEKHNGLLVLDECGVFFNSREWADKGRQSAIAWLLHSRKKGWDVIFIVQNIELIDKQIRVSMLEHVGVCKRLDRYKIPFVGSLLDALGLPSRPPRMHVCSIKYGISQHAPVVDRWIYRGANLYSSYDTRQIFSSDLSPSIHTVLSPQYTIGRFLPPKITLKQYLLLPPKFIIFLLLKLLRSPIPLKPTPLPHTKKIIAVPLSLTQKKYIPPQQPIIKTVVIDGVRVFTL